ncbi:MAG: peptide ABC transporter substrate-binding protein [Treponema sp.]|nr:peptide ABC transporter substrate-binding protein [Treponema sp.]
MNHKSAYTRIVTTAATLLVYAFSVPFFAVAQESPAPEDDAIAELEEETSETAVVDENLQRTFVIIAPNHEYDLNPHTANYSTEAQFLIGLYEGLYSYDPKTLDPVPAIAESYKIARNKKRWTFTLREGAAFSDGTPITAESIRSSWLRLLANEAAPYASLLDCIAGAEAYRTGNADAASVGITARSERTLVVDLAVPTAHFPRILCHHAFSAVSEKEGVYSGAYCMASSGEGGFVLAKNEHYWDAARVALPEIAVQYSDALSENSFRFNAGEADWVLNMVDTSVLLNPYAIRIAAEFGTEYLFFSARNAPWNDADFRNALLSAVPWEKIRAGSLVQADTLVYPLSGYPSVEGLSDTSPEDAADMMAEARKKAGIAPDERLTLIFGISKTSERQRQQAELLKAAWEPLGVNFVVQSTTDDRYLGSIPYWNCDLFCYSWIGDFADPTAFLELFRYGSTLNQTKWHNERFENLLREAAETTDSAEHYKLLSRAEQVLLDDGLILPISHQVSLHAVNPNAVGGWYPNALDIHPLKYLFLKEDTSSSAPNIVMR